MTTAELETPAKAAEIVRSFFREMEAGEVDAAMDRLTDDAVWVNVSLPTVRGRVRIERLVRRMKRYGGFRAHFHAVATEGDVVITERTDGLSIGRFEQRFWVYGRFELRDGKIALWKDSFDWLDIGISLVRGAAGAIFPRLNRPWPTS